MLYALLSYPVAHASVQPSHGSALQTPGLRARWRLCHGSRRVWSWATGVLLALGAAQWAWAEPLSFASAPAGQGYSKVFANLNAVCGAKVPMQEVNTASGLENLMALSEKTATLGVAQYDTWLALSSGDESIAKLRGLATVGYNLMHIVVLAAGVTKAEGRQCVGGKEIFGKCIWGEWKENSSTTFFKTELQLKGHKVAAVGAAQGLARAFLNTKLELDLTVIDVAAQPGKSAESVALDKLKSGEVQAVIFMGSHPEATISALKNGDKANDKFALASFYGNGGNGMKIIKKNYKNLNAFNTAFLAVPNILWVRPVEPNGDTGKQINELKTCLSNNLQTLQDKEGFESGWAEASMTMPDDVPVWTHSSNSATTLKAKK